MAIKCNICTKNVLRHARQLKCYSCKESSHLKCLPNVSQNDSIYINRHNNNWLCLVCSQSVFPFNHLTDNFEFQSAITENNGHLVDMNLSNLVFNPLELNEDERFHQGPLADSDPDLQYYNDATSIGSISHCDYHLAHSFNRKICDLAVNNQCFSVLHLNIRSIPKNLSRFEQFTKNLDLNFTVMGFSETWLNESNVTCYSIPGYVHYYLHRSTRRGGGVSLFINDNIHVKVRSELNIMSDTVEALFVEISKECTNFQKDAVIGVVYRPPNQDVLAFNEKLNEILCKIKNEKKIVYLMGDFNINILDADNHIPSSEFLDNIYSHSLFPLITKPSRITSETSTLIDNILYNDISNTNCFNGLFFTDISDHFPVFSINHNSRINTKNQIYRMQVMNEKCLERFSIKIGNVNWTPIIQNNNGQEAFTSFYEKYLENYHECFPVKMVKPGYHNRKPWLSEGMKKSIQHKNKLYIIQRKIPTLDNIMSYKKYKNELNKLLKTAERSHYHDLLQQNRNNAKRVWSVIKDVINSKKQRSIPDQFKIGDKLETDKGVIATKFNHYFNNIGKDLADRISENDKNALSFMGQANAHSIFLTPVDQNEVKKTIVNLKNGSAGFDLIHAKVIKATFQKYIVPLTHVLNLSITQGFFPNSMKIAKIIPIYKSGDPMLINNYRPISILPLFSKLLERLMYDRMMSFIDRYNILYKYQFGFRERHSTNMALTILTDHILSALDKGKLVIGVFLDFKKAFDTVNYDILFQKLDRYGIRGTALYWLKDYLNNRMQYVSFNHVDSTQLSLKCGVPQGSILGPLLFLLYINDIINVSDSLTPVIFADDTNVFMTGKSVRETAEKMNVQLSKLVTWLNANKLSLNVSKTNYMVFKSKSRNISHDHELIINGTILEQVSNTKFLGVFLDDKLKWDCHIQSIKSKIAKGIGIICKARKLLDQKTLITLYYTIIYPYLTYCIEVWGNSAQTFMSCLHRLQKKAVRIITSSQYRAPSEPIFKKLSIVELTHLYTKSIAIFLFKFIKGSLPSIFHDLFVRNCEVHSRNTRSSQKLNIPLCRTELYRNSIRTQGPKIWNNLENLVNHQCSIHTYKRRLTKYFLEINDHT